MLGAIIGDITGSLHEFTNNRDPKKVAVLAGNAHFTDDTAMTIAIARWQLGQEETPLTAMRREYYKTESLTYGARFRDFMETGQNFHSFGNGALMRISSCVLLAFSEQDAIDRALGATLVSHANPASIRCVIQMVQMCFGKNPGLVKLHPSNKKYTSLVQLRESPKNFSEHAETTLHQALVILGECHTFDDAMKASCSVGADADTLAAIVGTIWEFRRGIPAAYVREVRDFLPKHYLRVIDEAYESQAIWRPRDLHLPSSVRNHTGHAGTKVGKGSKKR